MNRRKFHDVYLPATLSTSAGFWHRPVTSQDSENALLCSILILRSQLSCCIGAASSMNHMITLHAPVFTKRNETHPKFFDALMNIQLEPSTTHIRYTNPYPLIVESYITVTDRPSYLCIFIILLYQFILTDTHHAGYFDLESAFLSDRIF